MPAPARSARARRTGRPASFDSGSCHGPSTTRPCTSIDPDVEWDPRTTRDGVALDARAVGEVHAQPLRRFVVLGAHTNRPRRQRAAQPLAVRVDEEEATVRIDAVRPELHLVRMREASP